MPIILKPGDLIARTNMTYPIYMVMDCNGDELRLVVVTLHKARFIVTGAVLGQKVEKEYLVTYPEELYVKQDYFQKRGLRSKYKIITEDREKHHTVIDNPYYNRWIWSRRKHTLLQTHGVITTIPKPIKEKVYDVLNYRHPSSILEDGEKAYSFMIEKNKPKQRPKKNQTIIVKR